MVAAIDVGRVGREVLAAQTHGNQSGEPADHQTFGVDQHPLLRHLGGLCRKRFHVRKSVKMEIGARCAELRGFLENDAPIVNANSCKINKQKQRLINMV
jgi:hypothetical protein